MEERRKNPFCGPKHKTTPTLGALYNAIQAIINESTMDKGGERLITDTNYAGKMKSIGIFARSAAAEIDKLVLIENKEVDRIEKEEKKKGGICAQ